MSEDKIIAGLRDAVAGNFGAPAQHGAAQVSAPMTDAEIAEIDRRRNRDLVNNASLMLNPDIDRLIADLRAARAALRALTAACESAGDHFESCGIVSNEFERAQLVARAALPPEAA